MNHIKRFVWMDKAADKNQQRGFLSSVKQPLCGIVSPLLRVFQVLEILGIRL